MKRRNADCGKIRRPIKKNKIAEQIGSNTLLYVKFLLLWASVITADFLLEFRFEFLWPFWLLLRSVYDSFKYKGLAFSVLFVCIAITSDLVCLFFIPVQWLFFAASTYVWVQYVWHTDKGICLPTIILWILFVYLEAAIRWKDSRNIPHLDLCRPFAAHCIGYPVVTLGFGFKSYVGYCIRQRKQREVAKDNDFYMQLLQEALPKDESTLLDQVPGDGSSGTGSEQQLQKDLIVVTATTTSITASAVSMSSTLLNSMNTSSSSSTSSSSRSDTGQNHHHHHPHNHHNHHHHNHQQQQQQPNTHSKSAQNHKSPSNSTVSTSHVNGHVSSGSSPSVNTSAMNGGLNHQPSSGQGSSKHRKSLDKDSSSTSSSASSTSNGSIKGSNGGGGAGGSGNFSYHQAIATFPQSNGGGCSTASNVATVTASSTKETSVSGAPQRGNDHGSNHVTSGPTVKDTKDSTSAASVGQNRKDSDKESSGNSVMTPPTGVRSANGVANRSKSPADGPSPCTGKAVGKQVNGHVPNLEPSQVQPPNAAANGLNGESSPVTVPVMEAKSSRSGRKNRLKQQQKAADQANISTIAKIFATLGLASTVTTLTTATTSTASGSSTTNSANFGGTTSTTATDCGTVPGSKDGREDGAGVQSGHESSPSARGGSGNTQQSADVGDVGPANAAQPKLPANGPPVPSSPTVVMVQKACEACPRLEGDLKKVRAEVAAHRQAESELRQKYDTTASNLKGCLQAKQKDCDELQSRYQELSNQRQQERQSLQTVERRLGEERRLRQSLESQLGNERKHRKLAEERVSRGECSEACMAKKRQMQLELDKLKHELLSSEESKHLAEKQTRSFEQEMRKFEVQLRNRESQQNTEVLMSALAAMQDKNATLEKSLSAETRVKLDLFSALGGARREVDILTCSLRSKEKEILDLNAKIVQLVAVMPTMPNDTLCLTGPVGSGTGQDGGPGASMMRLPDAPQLLPQPMSGGLNGVGGAGSGGTGQQPSPMSHMVLNGQPLIGQLGGGLGVLTSTMTTVSSSNSVCPPPGVTLASLASGAGGGGGSVGQLVQMQSTNQGNGNCPSGLDPNATVYTPKNNGMVGGTEA